MVRPDRPDELGAMEPTMTMSLRFCLGLCAGAALAACSNAAPVDPAPSSTEDPMVSVTEVELHPDGTYVQRTERMSASHVAVLLDAAEKHKAANANTPDPTIGSTSQAISQNTGICFLSNLVLRDGFDNTGNVLCLSGAGSASLQGFSRCVSNVWCAPNGWAGAVRWVRPGSRSGLLFGLGVVEAGVGADAGAGCAIWSPYRNHNADACEQAADSVKTY